ncbi:50S ribosomal protein L11 methyltransferase [Pedosphaera parvula]|uniref:Ribosomal protein L11 methyltransferase n=1 Tax=Pedosphaera parvula (strain Ellin514) TaxID=320771 RepID=B9XR71_PEDPL|nr:50S ribosomal protein L11 methyltransferase [Pedosphaera parvula]EEF57684.1 ribosomal L11 methyltransferase [Pedosphaera parvula Ellin514]
MKKPSLWQVSITTSLEAEEAVVELLARVFARASGVYTNEETKITIASVYCQKQAEWTPKKRAALVAGLKQIKASGLDLGAGKISVNKVAREDWSESWKRHFKPIEIGSQLLVKPSWIKRRLKKNQALVVLDPGLSFGTGNHPTTSFCLHEIVRSRKSQQAQSFLDIGTGSGILSISAVKLGYKPVVALDFDPEAVRVARENALLNGVDRQLRITRKDVTKLPLTGREKFDLICANLISNLLVSAQKQILSFLKPGGTLVLAGILKEEFPKIEKAFKQAGLKKLRDLEEGEWRSGSFTFPA